jgi:hypothetical protein
LFQGRGNPKETELAEPPASGKRKVARVSPLR